MGHIYNTTRPKLHGGFGFGREHSTLLLCYLQTLPPEEFHFAAHGSHEGTAAFAVTGSLIQFLLFSHHFMQFEMPPDSVSFCCCCLLPAWEFNAAMFLFSFFSGASDWIFPIWASSCFDCWGSGDYLLTIYAVFRLSYSFLFCFLIQYPFSFRQNMLEIWGVVWVKIYFWRYVIFVIQ